MIYPCHRPEYTTPFGTKIVQEAHHVKIMSGAYRGRVCSVPVRYTPSEYGLFFLTDPEHVLVQDITNPAL